MSVNSLDPSEEVLPIERFPQEDEGLISGEQKTSSSRTWKVLTASVFIGSCTSLVISSVYLRSIFIQFIKKCSSLPSFSIELLECRDSFNVPLNSWQFTLIISTIALGYLCQKSWEFTSREKQEITNERAPLQVRNTWGNYFHKFKYAIASMQVRFSYEANIALGYLYNGLWIYPNDSQSWKLYFACRVIAISLGGTLLGMYLRIQQYNLKHAYSSLHPHSLPPKWRNDWKEYCVSGIALGIFVSSLFFFWRHPNSITNFITYTSVFLVTRSIGSFFSKWIESKKVANPTNWKEKSISCISASVFLQTPLVLIGYFCYLKPIYSDFIYAVTTAAFFSLGLIGFAMGIQDARFVPFDYQQEEKKSQIRKNDSCMRKIAHFAKNYWMTIILVSGAVALRFIKFDECGVLTCPFSFELDGLHVYIDGKGISVALMAGLSAFYARKVFKRINKTQVSFLQNSSRFFLKAIDKYQFDLISFIPLAVFTSCLPVSNFSWIYASYNPYFALILLGYTFGVYKEQMKSRTGAQVLPGFTNVGVMITPL